jgi:hypothetical protein
MLQNVFNMHSATIFMNKKVFEQKQYWLSWKTLLTVKNIWSSLRCWTMVYLCCNLLVKTITSAAVSGLCDSHTRKCAYNGQKLLLWQFNVSWTQFIVWQSHKPETAAQVALFTKDISCSTSKNLNKEWTPTRTRGWWQYLIISFSKIRWDNNHAGP